MQELLLIKLPTCNQCSSPGDSDEHRSTSECPMQECLGLLCLLSWRPWGAWMDVHKATNGQPGQVKQAALYSFTGMWLTSIYFGLCTFQKLNLHPLSIWGMLYIQCKSFSVDWISLISLFPLHAHFCAHVRLTLSLGQTHLSWCRQLNEVEALQCHVQFSGTYLWRVRTSSPAQPPELDSEMPQLSITAFHRITTLVFSEITHLKQLISQNRKL